LTDWHGLPAAPRDVTPRLIERLRGSTLLLPPSLSPSLLPSQAGGGQGLTYVTKSCFLIGGLVLLYYFYYHRNLQSYSAASFKVVKMLDLCSGCLGTHKHECIVNFVKLNQKLQILYWKTTACSQPNTVWVSV